MRADAEGFLYPAVDEKKCIGCGKCRNVCPVLRSSGGHAPKAVLAVKNRVEKVRASSSSGGVFYELAKKFIGGGAVYGCALDENMTVRHICVEDIRGLDGLKGSKYVQSDMGQSYSEIRDRFERGERILFSGTPCQAVGLRRHLNRDYENLLVVDMLCHGVPSPKLFADYFDDLSGQYSGGRLVSVDFCSKQYGWKRRYMDVRFENGLRHDVFSGYDRYESLLLDNLSLRPSCFECRFAKEERFGDITLGDFWGIRAALERYAKGPSFPVWFFGWIIRRGLGVLSKGSGKQG